MWAAQTTSVVFVDVVKSYCEDVLVLQFWLGSKACDYPAVRHLQQTYGLPSAEVSATQQESNSVPKEDKIRQLPNGDEDRGINRDALKRIRGCSVTQLSAACCQAHLITRQCQPPTHSLHPQNPRLDR